MIKKLTLLVLIFVMMTSGIISVNALSFEDAKGHWAEEFIEWVSDNGYLIGDENGMFKPNAKISKAEVVVILNRLMKTNRVKEFSYTDVLPEKWYYEDIGKGLYSGIIDDGETFQPESSILREDSMLMIARAYGLKFNEKSIEKFDDHETITQKGAVGALVDANIVHGCSDGNLQPKRELHRGEFAKMIRDIVGVIGTPKEKDVNHETNTDQEEETITETEEDPKTEEKTDVEKIFDVNYTIHAVIDKATSLDKLPNTAVFAYTVSEGEKLKPPSKNDIAGKICTNNSLTKESYTWGNIKWTYPDGITKDDEVYEDLEIRGDITATEMLVVNFKKQFLPGFEPVVLTDLEGYSSVLIEKGKTLEKPANPSDIIGPLDIPEEDPDAIYKFDGWYKGEYVVGASEYDFSNTVNEKLNIVALYRKVQAVDYFVSNKDKMFSPVSFNKEYLYGKPLGAAPPKEDVIKAVIKEKPEYDGVCYEWGDLAWVYPAGVSVGEPVKSDLSIESQLALKKKKITIKIEVYEKQIKGEYKHLIDKDSVTEMACGDNFTFTPSNYVVTASPGNPSFYTKTDGAYIPGIQEDEHIRLEGNMFTTITTPDPLFENTTIWIRFSRVN